MVEEAGHHLVLVHAGVVEHDHAPVLQVMLPSLHGEEAVFSKTSPVRSVWAMRRDETKSRVVHRLVHADVVGDILLMNIITVLFAGLFSFLESQYSVFNIMLNSQL